DRDRDRRRGLAALGCLDLDRRRRLLGQRRDERLGRRALARWLAEIEVGEVTGAVERQTDVEIGVGASSGIRTTGHVELERERLITAGAELDVAEREVSGARAALARRRDVVEQADARSTGL